MRYKITASFEVELDIHEEDLKQMVDYMSLIVELQIKEWLYKPLDDNSLIIKVEDITPPIFEPTCLHCKHEKIYHKDIIGCIKDKHSSIKFNDVMCSCSEYVEAWK